MYAIARTARRHLARLAPLLLLPALAACGGSGGGGGGVGPPPGPDVTPPTVTLLAPTAARALLPGDRLRVAFTADDDRNAVVQVLLDRDGDLQTTGDQVVLYTGTDQNGTPVALDLGTAGLTEDRYSLFVRVDDGTHAPVSDGAPKVVVYPALAGVSAPRANRYGVTGGFVVFSVGEAEQGATILNADGDAGDGVVSVVDALEGVETQTGLSIDVSPVGVQPTAQILPADTDGIAWHQREADQGQFINGDLDQADTVVCYVAPVLGISASTNATGGALLSPAGAPGRRVVQYDEVANGADLNGDGDALDRVVTMLDYATNTLPTLFPLQLRPGTFLAGSTGYGAYLVDEATQGPGNTGLFLNGDADMLDTLAVVVDLNAGAVASVGSNNVDPTGALGASPSSAFPLAAYYVDEALASPGLPLNGDIDSTDFVPAVNVGAPVERFPLGSSPALNAGPGGRYAFAHGPLVVQLAAEEAANDFNADGDTTDTEILWWADASVNPPVWKQVAPGIGGLAGLALDGGSASMVEPGWIGLSVAEVSNGTDLNGDGDQADQVYVLVDVRLNQPVVHVTGIVPLAPASLPLPGATLALTGVGGDTGVVIQATESANGDLNGDGDAVDTVLVYFDWSAPTTPVVLGDTGGLHAAVQGGVIAVTAYEGLTNEDHNGDGDTLDLVFRVFDTTGAVLEPGILSDQGSVPATDDGLVWAYLRSEVAEQRDLNGDGDTSDLCLGVWLR